VIVFQPNDLSIVGGSQEAVVAVSGRCPWSLGRPIAGTVDGLAAAADGITPGEIWTTDGANAGYRVLLVPPNSTYMELGAWGDSAAITPPVLEIWRAHGDPSDPGIWAPVYNTLGSTTVTLDGTIRDTNGGAGPAENRYVVDEGAIPGKHLFDVRGARLLIVKLNTVGAGGNWSAWHRFF